MRIRTRFFLAFLITGLSVVLITALLAAAGFNRGLDQYLADRREARLGTMAEQFAAFYESNQRWPESPGDVPGVRASQYLARHLVLLDPRQQPILGQYQADRRYITAPVVVAGQTRASLALPHWEPTFDPIDERFRDQQYTYLLLASGLALLMALVVSWWLARQLVRPVLRVAHFTQHLAKGDYQQRLETGRQDELGQLMVAINQLAEALQQAEHARDRWLADISHELRTPVAILRGEIEALLDGVRQPDSARLGSLQQEVQHLQKLLDDLHTLALADAGTLRYQFSRVDLAQIIRSQAELFEPRLAAAGLELDLALTEPAPIRGDPERLRQLVANLLSNSQKYTTAGGGVRVGLELQGANWRLTVADSAPGVPAESRERLFERLFRLEDSRNRSQGGSGLGLAICRRIVEAHGGHIRADASELGGLLIEIELPEAYNG